MNFLLLRNITLNNINIKLLFSAIVYNLIETRSVKCIAGINFLALEFYLFIYLSIPIIFNTQMLRFKLTRNVHRHYKLTY